IQRGQQGDREGPKARRTGVLPAAYAHSQPRTRADLLTTRRFFSMSQAAAAISTGKAQVPSPVVPKQEESSFIWTRRHLVDSHSLSVDEVKEVLKTAKSFSSI